MMGDKLAKLRTIYVCSSCGSNAEKWLGRCPDCGEWNTFVEETRGGAPSRRPRAATGQNQPTAISALDDTREFRVSTGVGELDRVLGGGLVPGSAVLIGGDPGIGKSTLMLQAMGRFAATGHRVLYVTGEESLRQIRLRGERTGVVDDNILVYAETSVERVTAAMEEGRFSVVVIDSVQTLSSDSVDSAPGSVAQVREVSARLIGAAKTLEVPVFLVGHVTKDGAIAGPKVLEHMVDTVLYFEGDRAHAYRVLRAVKNRFGSVMEIGVFDMKEGGLAEVANPSEIFLADRPEGASGSAVVASIEGTRTILVEVQSLVCATLFGVPRRTVVGVDQNKVMLLAAVLEKKAGMSLANHDIFLKVAGGLRLDEPAIDLGILSSLASNLLDRAIDAETVVFGEVGLAGEVRAISQPAARIAEARKLGFKRCVMPKDNLKGLGKTAGMELVGVSLITDAIESLFGAG